MKKNELFLEEAVLDDLASGMEKLEVPVAPRVFHLLFAAVILTGCVVAGRVFALGWFEKDFYSRRAYLNANEIKIIPPERGLIVDRYGKPIAKNEPSFRLVLRFSEFLKAHPNPDETLGQIEDALGVSPRGFIDALRNADVSRDDAVILLADLSVAQVLKVKELYVPGVSVEDSFRRSYENAEAFAHLAGYVGLPSKEDLKRNPKLQSRDSVGKSGLEAAYDDDLRGTSGEETRHRNVHGEIIDKGSIKDPAPGFIVETTVDKDLQSYFYLRLKQRLDDVGSSAGVGIALNPRNGEVLSLVSIPSFNNGAIDQRILTDSRRPLFNRAISGLYSPGSTIKPLVAVGALNEGVLRPSDRIFSRGSIEIPNPYNPAEPSRFVDWKPHGWVDVYSALARSSNIYFYAAGGGLPNNEAGIFSGARFPEGLGVSGLKKYWEKFGLGLKTGIGIPGEAKGFLPDAKTKMNNGGLWRIGDTYNVSIGQGDLLVTPVGLLNYVSAIANGGKLYGLTLVKKVMDGNGAVTKEIEPRIIRDLGGELGRWIVEVGKGMRDGVRESYGTSHTLADLPFAVAAKTGSAQTNNNQKIDAFFVGYGPVSDGDEARQGLPTATPEGPEIAILVLIENAREGSLNAVPVAKDVFRWYYDHRIMNKE
ncbi:hypothetical protein HY504_01865 [Candidatus Wolfebacteria bacterium]|nr:hypothetical protein [Candidatus Wolfebacteria bacterium]